MFKYGSLLEAVNFQPLKYQVHYQKPKPRPLLLRTRLIMKAHSLLLFAFFCFTSSFGTPEKCFFVGVHKHPVQVLEGQCEKKCEQDPLCTHYQAEPLVFHFRLGYIENCYLLKGNVSWSESRPATKKTCGVKNTWKRIGDNYIGTHCLFEFQQYRNYPLVSGEDCFQLCMEHSRCTHFNFIEDEKHSSCQLMQGIHKGMKGATLVAPKANQVISCGYMKDYKMETTVKECKMTVNNYKMEKRTENQEATRVMQHHLREDYSYLYYVFSFVGGMFSTLFLYSISCICKTCCAKSIEI